MCPGYFGFFLSGASGKDVPQVCSLCYGSLLIRSIRYCTPKSSIILENVTAKNFICDVRSNLSTHFAF